MERRELDISGVRRTYWLARARTRLAPLLIALHGPGMDGRAMARFTGLATLGPAAGITTVFPDGWKGAWHAARPPDGEPDLDDVLFLAMLSGHLEAVEVAQAWPVFLAGISNGALFAEHVARHGLLPVTGLFLVAGTALAFSRQRAPVPLLRTTMTCVMGTGDPSIPYQGGQLSRRGISGVILRRRAARHGELPGEDIVAGAEQTCADWAAANRINSRPRIAELPAHPGDLTVTRKTWSEPGTRPVTLYSVDGGGHGWPGGPQFPPARVIGPIARHLDATALLLDMARHESGSAAGRALERGPAGGYLALPAAQQRTGSWPTKVNMTAPPSSGAGVPVNTCAPTQWVNRRSDIHARSKPRSSNQSQTCGTRSGPPLTSRLPRVQMTVPPVAHSWAQ
jgi:polyhydroxybutyrate depolymerase